MIRRLCGIVGILAVLGLLGIVGCTSAVTPTPTAALSKPTAIATSAAKPAATPETKPAATTPVAKPSAATPAAKPAAATPGASSAARPAAKAPADWKADWEKTLAAAKKEGKVVVAGGPGQNRRNAAMAFQKAYPDIKLEFSGVSGSDFASKLAVERDGGQFLWDLHLGGAQTMNGRLRPKGMLAPLRPLLILPELLDDSKWLGGFEDGWADGDEKYVYQWLGYVTSLFRVNRDFVPESELSKIEQLLEPKWKGKIVTQDPRLAGSPSTGAGVLLLKKGEEWLRKFFAQDLVIVKDGRTQTEWLVRGRNPVAYGAVPTELVPFHKEGLGLNVKPLDVDNPAAVRLAGGTGFVVLIDKAPHPNAAKVFINWLLSKEGQKAYVDAVGDNSRRLDVQGPPGTAPNPKISYPRVDSGEHPSVARAIEIAKEVIK